MEPSLYQYEPNRRDCTVAALLAAIAGLFPASVVASSVSAIQNGPRTILVLGDSLSAEYGLKRGSGWVALMEVKLKAEKVSALVINASISGETTAGGRSRLSTLLAQHKPDIVIIELGSNDALRGLPLPITQDNLGYMTQISQRAGASVLLIGMQLPPNYGREYSERFAALYSGVAKTREAQLVPFLLKGIADGPDVTALFQADRIHPKEEAQPLMLSNVWPELKKLLR
jgi:acyl-CoA thioesterase-1